MKKFSRRDVLKTSALASAAAAVHGLSPIAGASEASSEATELFPEPPLHQSNDTAMRSAGRERLLLDFGWRFHFGHAGALAFDDSQWRPLDLPHDWAIELPFQNDPALRSKGFYPLGKKYPATSVGWYRRVFELPAEDKGKRITVEFDGAYREAMVVFNNFYVGRHSGGYDPFSFDLTDFATPGGRNVLLVRVDATSSDGWFYEGAGIYRHVWLVKTNPLYVPQWGTFVKADVKPNEANLSIRTDVANESDAAKSVRVISTVLSPSGETVARATSPAQSIRNREQQTYEQKVNLRSPQLWSLEK